MSFFGPKLKITLKMIDLRSRAQASDHKTRKEAKLFLVSNMISKLPDTQTVESAENPVTCFQKMQLSRATLFLTGTLR